MSVVDGRAKRNQAKRSAQCLRACGPGGYRCRPSDPVGRRNCGNSHACGRWKWRSSPAQHHLVAHELAVVFTGRAFEGTETRVRQVGRACPGPQVTPPLAIGACGHRLQETLVEEVAPQWLAGLHDLDLRLGGQTGTSPAGKGLGFVVADMAHGRMHVQLAPATQRHLQPTALAVAHPIQRVLPAMAANVRPAVGQPPAGLAVTPGLDEGQVLAVGHQAIGELVAVQPDAVTRRLVVEGEPAARRVADLVQTLALFDPAHRDRGLDRVPWQVRAVNRAQRVGGEVRLDVHAQQFLVLLLVVQTEFDEAFDRGVGLAVEPVEQRLHARVDGPAVTVDLLDGRTRQQAALVARVELADRLVVGVEQHVKAGEAEFVSRQVRAQQEGLEEPRHVRDVPFRRTGLQAGLRLVVLGQQRCTERLGDCTDRTVASAQFGRGEGKTGHGSGRSKPRRRRTNSHARGRRDVTPIQRQRHAQARAHQPLSQRIPKVSCIHVPHPKRQEFLLFVTMIIVKCVFLALRVLFITIHPGESARSTSKHCSLPGH